MKRIVCITNVTINVYIDPMKTRDIKAFKKQVMEDLDEILEAIMPFKVVPGPPVSSQDL